jgi:hypothetical protein
MLRSEECLDGVVLEPWEYRPPMKTTTPRVHPKDLGSNLTPQQPFPITDKNGFLKEASSKKVSKPVRLRVGESKAPSG